MVASEESIKALLNTEQILQVLNLLLRSLPTTLLPGMLSLMLSPASRDAGG
jgi:hypothetical protein